MKKQKSIWKRMTLKTYLLTVIWCIFCLAFGSVEREFVIVKNFVGLGVLLLIWTIMVFQLQREVYDSVGFRIKVVEK